MEGSGVADSAAGLEAEGSVADLEVEDSGVATEGWGSEEDSGAKGLAEGSVVAG